MISSILNVKEVRKTIKKAMYMPPIQVEAIFEGEATSLTGEMIIKPCNERLMTWRSNSIEHNRSDPLPALMSLPMIKRTLFTDGGQELHQANPCPMIKSAFIEENAEALLVKEWELSPVYANLWTELINIRGSKTTNKKKKGRLKLSLKKRGISG